MLKVTKTRGTAYVFCPCRMCEGQCVPGFADIARALYLDVTEDRYTASAHVRISDPDETGFQLSVGWRARTKRGTPRLRGGHNVVYEEWLFDGETLRLEYVSPWLDSCPPVVARTHGAVQRVEMDPAVVGRGLV